MKSIPVVNIPADGIGEFVGNVIPGVMKSVEVKGLRFPEGSLVGGLDEIGVCVVDGVSVGDVVALSVGVVIALSLGDVVIL